MKKEHFLHERAQELCVSRGGCPGLPVPNSPYGPCGRKAISDVIPQSSVGGRPGLSAPNSPYYGLFGRKATVDSNTDDSEGNLSGEAPRGQIDRKDWSLSPRPPTNPEPLYKIRDPRQCHTV